MNLIQHLFHIATIAASLTTVGGVLLHDTNVDKAVVTAATSRSVHTPVVTSRPGNDPHTHSERGSLHQAIRDLNASQPRSQPRGQEDRKYVQSKPTARGHHPFDNYTLPVVG